MVVYTVGFPNILLRQVRKQQPRRFVVSSPFNNDTHITRHDRNKKPLPLINVHNDYATPVPVRKVHGSTNNMHAHCTIILARTSKTLSFVNCRFLSTSSSAFFFLQWTALPIHDKPHCLQICTSCLKLHEEHPFH